jgi:HEAT repeat protein
VDAVTALLEKAAGWPARVRAAEALGVLAAGGKSAKAISALTRAAQKDQTALVREAAVVALGKIDPVGTRQVLEHVAKTDAEPRVQQAARHALGKPK